MVDHRSQKPQKAQLGRKEGENHYHKPVLSTFPYCVAYVWLKIIVRTTRTGPATTLALAATVGWAQVIVPVNKISTEPR